MSLLTNIIKGHVAQNVEFIEGRTMTVPIMAVTDGLNMTYCVDVDIGQKSLQPGTNDLVINPLVNVPLAANNHELLYAGVGSAVLLRRQRSGLVEVVGFAKRMPYGYTLFPVNLIVPTYGIPPFTVDPPVDIGIEIRTLTYEEIQTIAYGYGNVPYGAYGIFKAGVLQEVRA